MNSLFELTEALTKANEALAECNRLVRDILNDLQPVVSEQEADEMTEKEWEKQEADSHLHG